MEVISKEGIEAVSSLMEMGHTRAVESFSILLNQKVSIGNHVTDVYEDVSEIKDILTADKQSTVIVTELIGDFRGESYLIFSQEEYEQISLSCMAAFGNTHTLTEEAVLKEIDNILSAAVITEFSNKLNARLFGDVPKIVAHNELLENIEETSESFFLLSNAHFELENNLNLNPKFIWRLDSHFISSAMKTLEGKNI